MRVGGFPEFQYEALEGAEAPTYLIGNGAVSAAAAAGAHRAPIKIVIPHLRGPAKHRVLGGIVRGAADELLQWQIRKGGVADQQPQPVVAHALMAQKMKNERIPRHGRLEIRKIVGHCGRLDVHAASFQQIRINQTRGGTGRYSAGSLAAEFFTDLRRVVICYKVMTGMGRCERGVRSVGAGVAPGRQPGAACSAWARSCSRSSTSSRPIDSRTVPSVIAEILCCSALNSRPAIICGVTTSDSVEPRLAVSANSSG